MKIFWSWQSDTTQSAGRHFVREALDAAAIKLADHPDLEDAERPEIDSDTANVAGSPPIAETILGKIRDCAVFVADVTPIAETRGGKKVANPNVMLELGYALRSLGPQQIVLVMNQAEGASLKSLPFDLRHWRGPLTYSLAKGASEEQRTFALENLTDDLVTRLAPCLAVAASSQPAPILAQGVAAEPDDSSVWLNGYTGVRVSTDHLGEVVLKFDGAAKLYCRIIPAVPFSATRRDMTRTLDGELALSLIGDYATLWNGVTENGALVYNLVTGERVYAATQWFQSTGEVWGVNADIVKDWQNQKVFTDGWAARSLEDFLTRHCRSLALFNAPKPWRFVIGLSGLKGSFLPGGRYARGGWSAVTDTVHHEKVLADVSPEALRQLSFEAFRKVFDAFGAPNLDEASYEAVLKKQ